MGLMCLTADITMNYAFQRPFNALDAEGFQSEVIKGADAFTEVFQWPNYFPNIFRGISGVIACLPRWFTSRFMKPFALVSWCLEVSATRPMDAH